MSPLHSQNRGDAFKQGIATLHLQRELVRFHAIIELYSIGNSFRASYQGRTHPENCVRCRHFNHSGMWPDIVHAYTLCGSHQGCLSRIGTCGTWLFMVWYITAPTAMGQCEPPQT